MITSKFYINNNEVSPPKNWQELNIELNYSKDQFPQGNTISITDFEWVRENCDLLIKIIQDGLTGDKGIFEAPALRIDITDGTITKTVFDGYIDLTQGLQIKDKIKVIAKATSHQTVDWVNDVASGFTFEYLASLPATSKGAITSDMYKFMPYVISGIPNYEQAAIATLMVFTITQTIVKEIEEITDLISEAAGYFTTIPAILKLIIKIAYLIVLIATLIKLVKDLMKFLISPVKYHAGMYVRDLMSKACEYLGMNFKSDIWASNSPYYNEFIIPQKTYNPISKQDNQLLGFLKPDKNEQVGWFKGTFADLLNAMKTKYNAKIVVTGTDLYLIRKDKNALPPQYQLPDIYNPEYTYNTDELQANTLIEYQIDSMDTNTLQNYSGTAYQVICQPKVVGYRPFVMLKNFTQVSIPFARAATKTELTVPEKIIKSFLEVFDAIANVVITIIDAIITAANAILKVIKTIFKFFGINLKIKPIPTIEKLTLAQNIDNRKGMMMLSSDHFGIAKIFILQQGSDSKYNKINSSNDSIESAKAMWDGFHYVNSFVPYPDRPYGNQYMIKDYTEIGFDWNDFLQVIQNNRIYDSDGNQAILESLKFNPYKSTASMKIRASKIYTLNLQEKFLNPTGS